MTLRLRPFLVHVVIAEPACGTYSLAMSACLRPLPRTALRSKIDFPGIRKMSEQLTRGAEFCSESTVAPSVLGQTKT